MNLKLLEKENQIYNKTWAYCSSFLLEHKGLPEILNNYSVIAMGIKDKNVPDLFPKNSVGLLINYRKSLEIAKRNNSTLSIKHPAILTEYYFGELIYGKLHMLVIEIPKKFEEPYYTFQKSKYSKMFTNPEKIYSKKTSVIVNGIEASCLDICQKNKKLKAKLENHLNVIIPDENELDNILDLKKEIFNYEN